jgi:hypothetical protein
MTAFQKFDPHTFLKRGRRAPDRPPTFATFATFAARPPKSGILGTASEVSFPCDTGVVAAKGIELQIDHPAVEHDRKNQNLTPTPAKVAKAAKGDNNFRNFRSFRSPPSVLDGGTLPAIWEEARRDRFEELAAILEVDEGLPRAEAELLADRDTREAERNASPYASALAALPTYLASLQIDLHPDAILFRTRSGAAYGRETLGHDFAAVRNLAFPDDRRRLMDMRRSGVVEAVAGKADATSCDQWRTSDI